MKENNSDNRNDRSTNITINGNVTINQNGNEQTSERQPIDRTGEVLISNETSFENLMKILSSHKEVQKAAKDEEEEKKRQAQETKLRQLYGDDFDSMVDDTERKILEKAKRRPGAIQLRNYEPRIAKIDIGNGVCEVFVNGYAIYDNGDRKTVLWVPDCGSVTYYFGPLKDSELQYLAQKSEVGEDVLGPAPWYNALIIAGENQIERNLDHPKSIGTRSDADEEEWEMKPNYRWICGAHIDTPEQALLKKEAAEERREALTKKQREAYVLYYEEGYTQEEIAEKLGVDRSAISLRLSGARKRLSEDTEKYFSE